jgi:hypothetical protein
MTQSDHFGLPRNLFAFRVLAHSNSTRLDAVQVFVQPGHRGCDLALFINTQPNIGGNRAQPCLCLAYGLLGVRFHDGRHTAITTLAEKGLACSDDWTTAASY